MGWLAGWDQRIKLTIDHTKVDAAISWFPVTVFLDPTHGDCVFDELLADANRFKIAFTKADGTTELYGEIELWVDVDEEAVIHVSRSGWVISNTVDTDFYMYYDSDHADNTTYIGGIYTTPGNAVWDNDFELVYHMVDHQTNSVLDSTSNHNWGGKDVANNPIETTGKIGLAQDFDGIDDSIIVTNESNFDFERTDSFSISAIFKSPDIGTNSVQIVSKQVNSGNYNGWTTRLQAGKLEAGLIHDTSPSNQIVVRTVASSFDDNTYHSVDWTYDGSSNASGVKIYLDGDLEADADTVDTLNASILNDVSVRAGSRDGSAQPFEGVIDEVRISTAARSADWIKATYNSLWNTLLTYGGEEPIPTTAPPTTSAPTTSAPTTIAPTTVAPTTVAPTTIAPTVPPTTPAPTTVAPTEAPTLPPTTIAPTTPSPTTLPPTTLAPTTTVPTSLAPTTLPPTTLVPTTDIPEAICIKTCDSLITSEIICYAPITEEILCYGNLC